MTDVALTPLTGDHFTTDLQVSITNSGSPEVGVMGVELWVNFDPTVVTVDNVEVKNGFFDGELVVAANEVFYGTPTIPHPPVCDWQACIRVGGSGPVTNTTGTVATITWVAQAGGAAAIGIPVVGTGVPPGSILADPDGQLIPIDSTSVPDITVVQPGTIEGVVKRQGMFTETVGVDIYALAVDGSVVVTTTTARADGSFNLTVPWAVPPGGPYTIDARYPGYLQAQKSSVYSIGGATVDIGETTMVAGNVNGDSCINILDIVSIISKFSQTGLPASNPQDINDDGTVNILDLTVAAGSFSRCGPTAW